MRAMYFAVFLALAVTFAVPAQAEQSYVWDGSSLRPVQTTQGLACSNWALWYFNRGASQTPGSQWGAEIEKSAGAVLRDQQEAQKGDETWAAVKAKYHLNIPDSPQVHDNYLGPICVTKTAFDAKPGAVQAIEDAGELAGRISSLIGQLRTIINGARVAATTGYQGYYLQEGEKNQLEEYLDKLQEISEHVHQLQNALMQRLGPAMMQINGGIDTVTAQLGQAEANLPAIRKLVSAQPAPASASWIGKTMDIGEAGHPAPISYQEVPGGLSVKFTDSYGTTGLSEIKFSDINSVSPPPFQQYKGTVYVKYSLKAPTAWSNGGLAAAVEVDNQQDAQAAYDYLKAHIQ
jgi:hypothetical protein